MLRRAGDYERVGGHGGHSGSNDDSAVAQTFGSLFAVCAGAGVGRYAESIDPAALVPFAFAATIAASALAALASSSAASAHGDASYTAALLVLRLALVAQVLCL